MKIRSITPSAFHHTMAAILAGLTMSPPAAQATNYTWQCADDYWIASICWYPNGIPAANDNITVDA